MEKLTKLACLLLAIAVSGCVDSHITDAILVTNNSSGPVHFEVTTVGGENFPLVGSAAPGETIRLLEGSQLSDGAGLTRDQCTVGEIRALGRDGTIVATWPAPVCATTTLTIP
ncbi:MAG: hypothetical protein QOI92_2523 [Chloroflexota bacterium]|nr:hypothetical protein [Chloroflexota bacterium]